MNTHSALRSIIALFAAAASIIVPPQALGEPTDLDPTFGVGGIARVPNAFWLQSTTVYPDGRLALLVSDSTPPYAQSVVRLDVSGRIATWLEPVRALPNFSIDSLAVTQADRLVTLQNLLQSPTGETRATRHLDDGRPDPAFGESGNALVSRFVYSESRFGVFGEFSTGLAADPGGWLYTSTESRGLMFETWITRVGATGAPVDRLRALAPTLPLHYGVLRAEADGTVVALVHAYGQPVFGGSTQGGPTLVRMVHGVPDNRFGNGGIAFHAIPGWNGAHDFASTPDGAYVVVGQVEQHVAVVKFTSLGAVDAAFGQAGVAFLRLERPGNPINDAKVAVQGDGRVLVAASIYDVVPGAFIMSRIGIGRLTAHGIPDPAFAGGGVSSFWLERGTAVKFMTVRPDGRILVAAEIYTHQIANHRDATEPVAFQLLGGDSARVRPLAERRAIEYFHAGYGHYFLTADPHEIVNLDHVNPNGWARTGYSFRVWDDDDPSLRPACRFWSDQSFAPKSSHFYTSYDAECGSLKAGDIWRFERNAFSLKMPEGVPGSRTCPSDSQPLYRAYNNGQGGAPNHRYTTEPSVLDQVLANGWTMEGEAATRVFACVPLD